MVIPLLGDNRGAPSLGLIFLDGFESLIHLSIIFAYSWSSQNPGNVVRKNQYWQKLVEISPENT